MKIMGLKKDKLQMMNTCLTLQSCNRTCMNPVFQKSPWKEIIQEKLSDWEGTRGIRNTLWCSCGNYILMATHLESICCLDKYEIRESYFKGILSFVFEIFLSSNLLVRRK